MSKKDKQDFRKQLNAMLGEYYHTTSRFVSIRQLVDNAALGIIPDQVLEAFDTLTLDGYISPVYPTGSSWDNAARITGNGRMFFEAGGYKDHTTYADKLTEKAKNNKVMAWIIIFFIGLTSVFGTVKLVIEIIQAFTDK